MNPKQAVILSGQARTFKTRACYESQKWHVYRKLSDPWFFVSVADDEQAGDVEVLRRDYEHVFVERARQPEVPFPEAYVAAAAWAPFRNIAPLGSVLKCFWGNRRAWEFLEASCAEAGVKPEEFNLFMRMRGDSFFHSFYPALDVDGTVASVHVPVWGNYGAINDRFAVIFGAGTARTYFRAFDAIPEAVAKGCPFHPESLLCGVLELARVPIFRDLIADFSTLRLATDSRPDVPPQYLPGDVFRFLDVMRFRPRVAPVQAQMPPPEVLARFPGIRFPPRPRG